MKKTIIILGLAALTATSAMTMHTSTAEAGRGFRLGVGLGLGIGAGLALRHRHQHRHVYRAPVYTETYRATRAARAAPVTPALLADAQGREFDPATKVWFDGKDSCWTGPQKWYFKRGVWYYGNARWFQGGGTWRTSGDAEPVAVDCKSSALFAARVDTGSGQKSAPKHGNGYSDTRGNTARSGEAPVKTAVKPEDTAKDTPLVRECKKYFPAVGESVSVPCT